MWKQINYVSDYRAAVRYAKVSTLDSVLEDSSFSWISFGGSMHGDPFEYY